jgi:bile acid-coenzyme A ligase
VADQVSYGRRLTMLAAEHADDDVAVVFAAEDGGEQPITWKELEARANQVAHFLADRGVGQDDVVVVALRNSPEHLFTGFGAWKIGASVLPLRWDLPEWERDRLLAVAREANGKVVVAGWENAAPGTVTPDDIDATANLSSDPPEPDAIPPYTRLIATSGATGSPKIVVTPSPGVMAVDDELTQVMLATPGAPYLTTSPLYHVNGFAYAYNPLLQNNPIVLMERFDAARAVDLIERYDIAYTCMVPTMLMRVARLEDVQSRDFSSIQRIVYGGASIPEWVVRAWFELVPPERFAFSYGGSEGHGLVMTTGDQWLEHPGTVGKPLLGEAKILDEDGNELPAGATGNVYLEPEEPTFEYRGDPDLTRSVHRGKAFTLGDVGFLDEDGYLFLRDRAKDMIISGGVNIYPAEIEAVLTAHPAVGDVAVIGVPDPEWGESVRAVVEPAAGVVPTDQLAEELVAYCRLRLARYKCPRVVEFRDALPRTDTGKLFKRRLRDEYWDAQPVGERN